MPAILNWFGDRAKAAVMAEVDRRMDAAGRAIVAKAVELAPKDTGFLASTISYTYNQATMTLRVHVDAPYGQFVEFGHMTVSGSYVPPAPFVRPALAMAAGLFGSTTTTATLDFASDQRYSAGMTAQHGSGHPFGATARFGR